MKGSTRLCHYSIYSVYIFALKKQFPQIYFASSKLRPSLRMLQSFLKGSVEARINVSLLKAFAFSCCWIFLAPFCPKSKPNFASTCETQIFSLVQGTLFFFFLPSRGGKVLEVKPRKTTPPPFDPNPRQPLH